MFTEATWSALVLVVGAVLGRAISHSFSMAPLPWVCGLVTLVTWSLGALKFCPCLSAATTSNHANEPPLPPQRDQLAKTLLGWLLPVELIGLMLAGQSVRNVGFVLAVVWLTFAIVTMRAIHGRITQEGDPCCSPTSHLDTDPLARCVKLEIPSQTQPPRSEVSPDNGADVTVEGDLWQQWTRRRGGESETIAGSVRVTFARGERQVVVQLPIYPPFSAVPEVECEPLDSADVEIQVETAQPYGVRLVAKRHDPESPDSFDLGFQLQAPLSST